MTLSLNRENRCLRCTALRRAATVYSLGLNVGETSLSEEPNIDVVPTSELPGNEAGSSQPAVTPKWLVVLVVLLLIVAAAMFGLAEMDKQRQRKRVVAEALLASANAEKKLAAQHDMAEAAAETLRARVTNITLTPAAINAAVASVGAANPLVTAVGIALLPGRIGDPGALYGVLASRTSGTTSIKSIAADYPTAAWFLNAQQQANWSDPFLATTLQAFVVQYAVPLIEPDLGGRDQVVGVVFASIAVDELNQTLRTLRVGSSGYGFILSRDGRYLAHPIPELYARNVTAVTQARSRGDLARAAALQRVVRGDTELISFRETRTGRGSFLLGRPIAKTGWTLGFDLHENEMLGDVRLRYRLMVLGVTSLAFLLIALTALLLHVERENVVSWWRLVGVSALVIAAGIAAILALHLNRLNTDPHGKVQILDSTSQRLYQRAVSDRISAVTQAPLPIIPTGVYIQSLEFNSANNVTIGGYVWQRYDSSLPKDFVRGVIFPDATNTSLSEAYRASTPGGELIGYNFKATLRQPFNYKRYPFDRQDIELRIWPKSFQQAILLTPDLDTLAETDPASLPGLDGSLVLGGWTAKKSFYDYQQNDYQSTLGLPPEVGPGTTPELAFNILLQRSWGGPFLSNLFPLAMIAWMLFANMMNVTSKEKPWGVFGAIASLFFTIALAHSKTRDTFSAPEVLYLEYYYLLMYLMVAIVMINSFLITRNTQWKLLTYAENEIPRILYWPLLMLLLLGVTVIVFF